jgi:YgiT-type zinc finger domain-containing protein
MQSEPNPDLCAFCGAPGVKTVYKDKLFGKGAQAVIIENLSVRQCDVCGESYYDPEVSMMIDEILAHPEKHTVPREVSIASLAA